MPGLIQSGHKALLIDAGHDTRNWALTAWVENCEFLTEIAEDGSEETECVCDNDVDAVIVAVLTDCELVGDASVGQHNDLELLQDGEILCQSLRLELRNWCVCIQLCQSWDGDFVPWLSNILSLEKKLRRQIGNRNWRGVPQGQALNTGEGNVLCDLNAESFHSGDKDVGCAHALHSLVSKDIELTTIEALVDLVGGSLDRRWNRVHIDVGWGWSSLNSKLMAILPIQPLKLGHMMG